MESDEEEDDFNSNDMNLAEVRVAELQAGPPYACPSLKLVKGKEKSNPSNKSYSFDITKADQIFDVLLKVKQTILLKGEKMPLVEEIKIKFFVNIIKLLDIQLKLCLFQGLDSKGNERRTTQV